jgi:hypothetical protein
MKPKATIAEAVNLFREGKTITEVKALTRIPLHKLRTIKKARICKHCGAEFIPHNGMQRYCTRQCSSAADRAHAAEYARRRRDAMPRDEYRRMRQEEHRKRREKLGKPYQGPIESRRRTPEQKAADLIMAEYRKEARQLAKFDEQKHWLYHPEVARYVIKKQYWENRPYYLEKARNNWSSGKIKAYRTQLNKRLARDLHPSYVRKLLTQGTNLSIKDFPPELVELATELLRLKRIKKQKYGNQEHE